MRHRVPAGRRGAGRRGRRLALDVEIEDPTAAAERLLLAGRALERRMAVLRTRLARVEDELLRAVPVGVHVDEELKARLAEPPEPEVRDLDRRTLLVRDHDAGFLQAFGGV